MFELTTVFNYQTFSQVGKTKRQKVKKLNSITKPLQPQALTKEEKQNQEEINEIKRQQKFRSPFRYIIVSNITEKELELTIPQRRLEILMDEKAFSEKNLKLLFNLLEKRFPLPIPLEIIVHISLATIETPEEKEMATDGNRLFDEIESHKSAQYVRFSDGKKGFIYRFDHPPYSKSIVLKNNEN